MIFRILAFPALVVLLIVILFFLCIHAFTKGMERRMPQSARTIHEKVHPEVIALKTSKSKYARAILMSCPLGPSHTHRGGWKPNNMLNGIEGVLSQLKSHKSNLPLVFGFYRNERDSVQPWCSILSKKYIGHVKVECFEIPERYPIGLYGYAKILAIRHAPATEVLWLDCDVYPVRDLKPLFHDVEYRRSHAMFWPDSRDFFDENRAVRILSPRGQSMFPSSAWYVRQGFDSGLILLNRPKCAEEIHHLSQIARKKGSNLLRAMSMGDKDLFHLIWMLHERNFTLIPFISETGNIQAPSRSFRQVLTRSSRRSVSSRLCWYLSSQLKYGRDGNVYALHQLHKQEPYSLIATLSVEKPTFHSLRVASSTSHVKPIVVAMADLRLLRPGYRSKSPTIGDFAGDIERALIIPGSQMTSSGLGNGSRMLSLPYGVILRRAPQWMHVVALDMARSWKYELEGGFMIRRLHEDNNRLKKLKDLGDRYARDAYKRMRDLHVDGRISNKYPRFMPGDLA